MDFGIDDEGDWFATLECGHPQHVRHKPPFQQRPWVLTEAGRADKLGSELDCLFRNMPSLPDGAEVYKVTRDFDATSIPAGLQKDHRTKEGTWGRIVVIRGRLSYEFGGDAWVLKPGVDGIIPPQVEHRVRPVGAVVFRVEFLRAMPTRRT